MSLLKRLRKIYSEEAKQMDGGKLNYKEYVKQCGVPAKGEWDAEKDKDVIECKRQKKVVVPKVKHEGMSYKEYVKTMGVPKKGEWQAYQKSMDMKKVDSDIADIYDKAKKAPLLPVKPKKITKVLYEEKEPVKKATKKKVVKPPKKPLKPLGNIFPFDEDVYEKPRQRFVSPEDIREEEEVYEKFDYNPDEEVDNLPFEPSDYNPDLDIQIGNGLNKYKDFVSMYGVKNGSKMWNEMKGKGLVGGNCCCMMQKRYIGEPEYMEEPDQEDDREYKPEYMEEPIQEDEENLFLNSLYGDGLVGGKMKKSKCKGKGLVGGKMKKSKCKGKGLVGGKMKKAKGKGMAIGNMRVGMGLVGGNIAQICKKASKEDLKNLLMQYDEELSTYRPVREPIYESSSAPPPPPPMKKEEKEVSKEVLEYRKKEAEKLKAQQDQASKANAMQEELKAKLAKRRKDAEEESGAGLVGGKMKRKMRSDAPKKGSQEAKDKMAYLRSFKKSK
jgi:hypothetical protein